MAHQRGEQGALKDHPEKQKQDLGATVQVSLDGLTTLFGDEDIIRHGTTTVRELPEDDKENFPFPTVDVMLEKDCVCSWGEDCRKFQLEFTKRLNNGQPEWRGGSCISLNLGGKTAKHKCYMNAVVSALAIDAPTLEKNRTSFGRKTLPKPVTPLACSR